MQLHDLISILVLINATTIFFSCMSYLFRPMFGAHGLWVGRDLYRATPAVTRDLVFPVSSEGTPHSVAPYDTQEDVENLFNPGGSSRVKITIM
jgi:hypothetical protein